MAVLNGYSADLYIASGASVAFANEATTDAGDHKTYTITNSAKRFWDPSVLPTVQTSPDGITWTTVTVGFTLQYCGGKVLFTVANAVGTQVRASGQYFTVSALGGAKQWTLDIKAKVVDIGKFGDQWDVKQPLTLGATAKLGRWWIDSFFLTNLNNLVVIVMYGNVGSGTPRYEAYSYLSDDSINTARDNVIEQDLSMDISGQVFPY